MSHSERRVAYLVSQYPAFSHAFITTEIEALRQSGWEVLPVSVNRARLTGHPDDDRTFRIKAAPMTSVVQANLRLLATGPATYIRALRSALSRARGRGRPLRAILWQLFYTAQAAVLLRHLERSGVAHVHVHFGNNAADIAAIVSDLSRAGRNRPNITWSLTVHGPSDFRDAAKWGLKEKIRLAEFVTSISAFGLRATREIAPTEPASKFDIVRMGLSREEFERVAESAVSAPLPPSGDRFKVLFVGRLVPEKAPGNLLAALKLLSASPSLAGRHIEALFVGGGPLADDLATAAQNLPASMTVEFTGPMGHEEVLRLYRWADVFCLPSLSEGLPVVLMEALASGLPVITTPVAGIPELIIDGESGLLVEPGDVIGLEGALERLATDPVLRKSLAGKGRLAVMTTHDAAVNVERLAERYSAVVSGT
ncbi:MAG TPA: glycosyltransferase family 4 protein [Naasia sp.]